MVPFAGRTDLEIAHDMLEAAGIRADDGLLDRFEDELIVAMAARADELRERGRALPGAAGSLERLAGGPNLIQSPLTGQLEPNAPRERAALDLPRHTDFESGASRSQPRAPA